MISARAIAKSYGAGAGKVEALAPTDLEVRAGEFVLVLGKSGSGKSTLLGTLGGLLRPSAGRVLLDGRSLWELGPRQRARLRADDIGFVFQNASVIQSMTLVENVTLSNLFCSAPISSARRRALSLLDQVGLADRADAYPEQISGGEKRRVALASALMNRPRLLLADEPTGELDPETESDIMALMAEVHRQGTTLVIVTHNPALGRMADRVLTLGPHGLSDQGKTVKNDR